MLKKHLHSFPTLPHIALESTFATNSEMELYHCWNSGQGWPKGRWPGAAVTWGIGRWQRRRDGEILHGTFAEGRAVLLWELMRWDVRTAPAARSCLLVLQETPAACCKTVFASPPLNSIPDLMLRSYFLQKIPDSNH